jgi:hypothetical protein
VEDEFAARHGFVEGGTVEDAAFVRPDLTAEPRQPSRVAGRQVIEDAHHVSALDERRDEMMADEPRAARHQYPHGGVGLTFAAPGA